MLHSKFHENLAVNQKNCHFDHFSLSRIELEKKLLKLLTSLQMCLSEKMLDVVQFFVQTCATLASHSDRRLYRHVLSSNEI